MGLRRLRMSVRILSAIRASECFAFAEVFGCLSVIHFALRVV